ncbi:hypothetical protein PG988_010322 [Apiospora saccharicola]
MDPGESSKPAKPADPVPEPLVTSSESAAGPGVTSSEQKVPFDTSAFDNLHNDQSSNEPTNENAENEFHLRPTGALAPILQPVPVAPTEEDLKDLNDEDKADRQKEFKAELRKIRNRQRRDWQPFYPPHRHSFPFQWEQILPRHISHLRISHRIQGGLVVFPSRQFYRDGMTSSHSDPCEEANRFETFLTTHATDCTSNTLLMFLKETKDDRSITTYPNYYNACWVVHLVIDIFANKICKIHPTETTPGERARVVIIAPYEGQQKLYHDLFAKLSDAEFVHAHAGAYVNYKKHLEELEATRVVNDKRRFADCEKCHGEHSTHNKRSGYEKDQRRKVRKGQTPRQMRRLDQKVDESSDEERDDQADSYKLRMAEKIAGKASESGEPSEPKQ